MRERREEVRAETRECECERVSVRERPGFFHEGVRMRMRVSRLRAREREIECRGKAREKELEKDDVEENEFSLERDDVE